MPGFPNPSADDINYIDSSIDNSDSSHKFLPAGVLPQNPEGEILHLRQTSLTDGLNATVDLPEDLNCIESVSGVAPPIDQSFDQRVAERFVSHLGSGANGSIESEHDLAAMVHDFMENGSYGSDFVESSDSESGASNGPKLFETLQALKSCATSAERELLSALTSRSLSIKERELTCLWADAECKGGCIRRLLVKHLRLYGYDAAVCSSKWQNSGRVPGGEYEYIDVMFEGDLGPGGRLIVDIDFQSQFEIARPTHTYLAALKYLPVIFVGTPEKLGQILQVMAEAAKLSLRQNSMPLPPWRTIDYMTAKWMSLFERKQIDTQSGGQKSDGISRWTERRRTKQCVEQLRNLRMCIAADTDKTHIGKGAASERNRVIAMTKIGRPITSSAYTEKSHFTKASAVDKSDEFS